MKALTQLERGLVALTAIAVLFWGRPSWLAPADGWAQIGAFCCQLVFGFFFGFLLSTVLMLLLEKEEPPLHSGGKPGETSGVKR